MPVCYYDVDTTAPCARPGGCLYGTRNGLVVWDGVRLCALCSRDLHNAMPWYTSPGLGDMGGLFVWGTSAPDDLATYEGPFQAGQGTFTNGNFTPGQTYDVLACFVLVDASEIWLTVRRTATYIRQNAANKARILAALDAVPINRLSVTRGSGLIYWRQV